MCESLSSFGVHPDQVVGWAWKHRLLLDEGASAYAFIQQGLVASLGLLPSEARQRLEKLR